MPTDRRGSYPPALALGGVAAILFVLFGFGSTSASAGLLSTPWDKVVHAGMFAFLAVGLRLSLPKPSIWVIAGLGLLIGMADEAHQFLVPNRQPGLDDLLADVIGLALGLMAWRLTVRRLSPAPCRTC